jgi:TatD DNase family protein
MTSGGPALSLADSHVHLHAYDDAAIAGMLDRAQASGVDRVVAVSVDLPSARRTLQIAGRHPDPVVAAVGLHPGHLTEMPDDATWAALEQLAEHPLVGAIGECGVEGVDGKASGLVQLAALARHARLAVRLGKPLLLHLRGDDLIGPALGVLASASVEPGRAVVHYFVGDGILAGRYLAAGLLIAVGKPMTRLGHLQDAVRTAIPLDRLLLETDTYPLQGRTTEPADVRLVAEAVAKLKRISPAEVAEATSANLAALLRWAMK